MYVEQLAKGSAYQGIKEEDGGPRRRYCVLMFSVSTETLKTTLRRNTHVPAEPLSSLRFRCRLYTFYSFLAGSSECMYRLQGGLVLRYPHPSICYMNM